ncbi:Aspartate 1-decarboxylase precursor [Caloramator mitchellensis]|uniref:Aspartate 1-decarboxylase n=1 Tax=Caloramator mitchellensis TaxID=908809 RepID=A0A0R3JT92_CALMK|nr:aspartate 1-decarboxylase [Caloramator mitchellensis]KRQ86739.1 Aspartate 1-decarboxylase precursor [Caloramator mitchellensis]
MLLNMLKSKIHRATVTEANLNYVGSITIDEDLMDAAGLLENERVQIVNINNGKRFDTYIIKGERGKGDICLNGAAARMVHPGDKVIIMAYCFVDENEAKSLKPKVVLVDENNRIEKFLHEEAKMTI